MDSIYDWMNKVDELFGIKKADCSNCGWQVYYTIEQSGMVFNNGEGREITNCNKCGKPLTSLTVIKRGK